MKDISPGHIARLDYLARQAIELYGADSQFNMAIEETSELLHALTKIHRNRQDWDNILEETVDTYIMTTEIFILFGPEAVNAMFVKKLDKFAGNVQRSIEKRQKAAEQAEIIRKSGEQLKVENAQIFHIHKNPDVTPYSGA